jgi:hypothetical protein
LLLGHFIVLAFPMKRSRNTNEESVPQDDGRGNNSNKKQKQAEEDNGVVSKVRFDQVVKELEEREEVLADYKRLYSEASIALYENQSQVAMLKTVHFHFKRRSSKFRVPA